MRVVKKPNCTITFSDYNELGLNSYPWKSAPPSKANQEIINLMKNHNLSEIEAVEIHKENLQWAN